MDWKEFARLKRKQEQIERKILHEKSSLEGRHTVWDKPKVDPEEAHERAYQMHEDELHEVWCDLDSLTNEEKSELEYEESEFWVSIDSLVSEAKKANCTDEKLALLQRAERLVSEYFSDECLYIQQEEGVNYSKAVEKALATSVGVKWGQLQEKIRETKDQLRAGIYSDKDPWRQPFTLEPSKLLDDKAQALVRQYDMTYEEALEKAMEDNPILKHAYLAGKMGYKE